MEDNRQNDHIYTQLLLEPLKECKHYRPAFGGEAEGGVSLEEFRNLYGSDPLYHWVGLDSELMYAAHKAAGGMTSIYRQLGIGCERLLRRMIQDACLLNDEQVGWSYEYEKESGEMGVHTLDARIDIAHLTEHPARERVKHWLAEASQSLGLPVARSRSLRGVVLEVRQGYKSADSKRQNADLRFGMRAYNENYLPVVAIVSTQMSQPVGRRYRSAQLLVLLGRRKGTSLDSTFHFFRTVVNYDMEAFFSRNAPQLRTEFVSVLKALLTPK